MSFGDSIASRFGVVGGYKNKEEIAKRCLKVPLESNQFKQNYLLTT